MFRYMKNIKAYYRNLNKDEKAGFVNTANCSKEYLEIHLFAPDGPRKMPRVGTMHNLADATKGEVPFEDVIAYFFEPEKRKAS